MTNNFWNMAHVMTATRRLTAEDITAMIDAKDAPDPPHVHLRNPRRGWCRDCGMDIRPFLNADDLAEVEDDGYLRLLDGRR